TSTTVERGNGRASDLRGCADLPGDDEDGPRCGDDGRSPVQLAVELYWFAGRVVPDRVGRGRAAVVDSVGRTAERRRRSVSDGALVRTSGGLVVRCSGRIARVRKGMTPQDEQMQLAAALGRVPSGLAILTIRNGDQETGMLVSWVQQCS